MRPTLHTIAILCGLSATFAYAQGVPNITTSDDQRLVTVVITGSHLMSTNDDTPSPVQIITAAEIHESGYSSLQGVLHDLTANGQGMLSQSFAPAFASGAGGIALRGLNVGSTLVLIDGHRMAPFPIGDDGQRSFVDISNLPFDSVERIEVLKDGASAIYGSDAIAGVVNIILQKSFQGAKLTADAGLSSHADGATTRASGIWGWGDLANDGQNFYVAAEYRRQQQIRLSDRGGIFSQTDFTSTGGYDTTPGVRNPTVGELPDSGTGYVTDSNGNIAGFMPGCNAALFAANQCTYRDNWHLIQPPTQNYNLVGKFTRNFGSRWQVSIQASYFESKARQVAPPSRAFADGYQGVSSGPYAAPGLLDPLPPTTIPATNPSYPAGTGLSSAYLRYTFLNIGPDLTDTDAKSTRAIVEMNGNAAGFDIDAAAGFTQVKLYLDGYNYVNPVNLQTALDSTTAPFLVGEPNTTAVNNFVAPALHTADTSKLSFGHVGLRRALSRLDGGDLAMAFGADYFQRNQYAVAPGPVAAGYYGGMENSFSNNFTLGVQQVASAYGEVVAPIIESLELTAAVRYDHYNLSGGKASPKVGFKFRPLPELTVRGTASKGFRAPGPAENGRSGQTFFAGTAPDPILCPNPTNLASPGNFVGQCNRGIAALQGTNPTLRPEVSRSFTLGLIFEPLPDLRATLDLWSIRIENQIVPGGPTVPVRGNNLAPLAQYQPDGSTALVTPPVAPISYFTASYINANTTRTDGLDLGFEFRREIGVLGVWKTTANWSYTHRYDITIDGQTYELAGTHGPFTVSGDTGNPRSRVQWSNTFGRANWSITGTLNFISSFGVTDPSSAAMGLPPQATCLDALTNGGGAARKDYAGVLATGVIPRNVSCTVGHFTTFDIYGRLDLTSHLDLHASVLNATNAHIPLDWATYGTAAPGVPYNLTFHQAGAIGPFFSLGVSYTF